MEIDISKYLSRGQYSGSFAFAYLPEDDLSLVPLCKIGEEVEVTGSFEISEDDGVAVKLHIRYLLKGQCSYCLGDAQQWVECDREVLFLTEKNDEDYFYDGRKLDLTTAVNEAILTSQPGILLCRDDCEGIDVK